MKLLLVSLIDVKRMRKSSWNQTQYLFSILWRWRESKGCDGCSWTWSSSPIAPCPRIARLSSHPEEVLQSFDVASDISKPPSMFVHRHVFYIFPSWGRKGWTFGLLRSFTFGSQCWGWNHDKSKKPFCLLGPCKGRHHLINIIAMELIS